MKRVICVLLTVMLCLVSAGAFALPNPDPPSHELPFEQLVGDNGDYDTKPGDWPAAGTYRIDVDIVNQVMTVYETATGEIVRQSLCTTGSSKNPSPTGKYEMGSRRVRFGFFVNHGVYGQYWTQITRNIYFHSLLYTKRNANTWTKSSYNNLGRRASHGCIRLPVPDARWVYFNIAPGTEINLVRGREKNEALRESLKLPAAPKTRPKGLDKVPSVNPGTTTAPVVTPAPLPTVGLADNMVVPTARPTQPATEEASNFIP